jgi:hypothetical protein
MMTFYDTRVLRTWHGRSQLVRRVLRQWQAGLPIRIAAKILRKVGIHPWSLAAHAPFGDLVRLARDLRLPPFVLAACHHFSGHGFHFQDVKEALNLPNGLVLDQLSLYACNGMKRFPRMLWAHSVGVEQCERVDSLSHRGGRPSSFRGDHCPRLEHVAFSMEASGDLILVGCPRLKNLPSIHRPRNLTLKDLPEIDTLGMVSDVVRLSLWRLPRLRNLSTTKVSLNLVIQDCPELRWLPKVEPNVRGCVLDGPSLRDQKFVSEPEVFSMEPCRDMPRQEGLPPVPRVQEVCPQPLPSLEEPETTSAWPWPPRGFMRELDEGLERTSKALGLKLLDRMRIHEATGHSTATTIRHLILREPGPLEAAHLGARLLGEALIKGDRQTAHRVCLEAERLGLGALSLGLLAHPQCPEGELDFLLGPFWGPRAAAAKQQFASYRLHWHHATGIPGPLVLDQVNLVSENTELRWLDGPLWAALPLGFSDCPRLERLPDLIVARGSLTIESCPRLEAFPNRLEVNGDLTLRNLPRLRGRECRIRVGGKILVENCPGISLLPMDTP